MAKRTVPNNSLTSSIKALNKNARRTRNSILPAGFEYVTIDGSLHIKNLETGETAKVV